MSDWKERELSKFLMLTDRDKSLFKADIRRLLNKAKRQRKKLDGKIKQFKELHDELKKYKGSKGKSGL